MDFLGGSSRVWAVENLFQSTLSQVVVVPGGSYRIITDALCELMDLYEPVWRQTHPEHPNIAYVIGGIPDLSTRLQGNGWGSRYEEVIMDSEIGIALDFINAELRASEKQLKKKGALPVYATIATMDLEIWNTTRLSKGKTSCLLYQDRYPTMQMDLNEVVHGANTIIRQINFENGVKDPDLARYIMTPREGCAGSVMKYKVRTGPTKFHDGCHPTPALAEEWSHHLCGVQRENRTRFSSLRSIGTVRVPHNLSAWPDIHKFSKIGARYTLTRVVRRN